MAVTVRDAESAYLAARADVQAWQEEFIQEWYQPEIDLALITFWEGLDPLVKQNLKAMQPAAYAQVDKQVRQMKERENGTSR